MTLNNLNVFYMEWSILHKKTTCGLLNHTLNVNEACLQITSNFDVPVKLYTKNIECYKCDFIVEGLPVSPKAKTSFIVDTSFGLESYFYDGKDKYCPMTNHFEDFGVYGLNISDHGCGKVEVLQKPENFWINLGLSVCFYFGVFIIYQLLKFVYKHCRLHWSPSHISLRELEMDLGNPNIREDRKFRLRRQARITSVDTFRGLAIIIMIFVNYGGGEYTLFKHTPWNGLGVADLVFPWFVWIMGASIVLSLRSSLRTSLSRRKIFKHILTRSLLLILFGIMLNSGKQTNHFLRIPGVLQRLGVTYFFVATIEMFIAKPQRNEQFGPWYYCQDILDSWIQWTLAVGFAMAHEFITFMLQVPGCPTGYLGPGGFSEHSIHRNCTGGAAGYIDRLIFSENHMYHHGSFVKIYKPAVAYDPEGLLGILTSILCTFLGVHAGRIILSFENPYSRIRQWLFWGVVTGLAAGFLCGWSQNDGLIPINKNLWSLSYVLACSSFAFFILAVFYWLIDFMHVWNGYPFKYPGMNALALYLGHSLLKGQLPWRWNPYTNTHLELLLMDVTATVIWLIISYIMYKKNVFITL